MGRFEVGRQVQGVLEGLSAAKKDLVVLVEKRQVANRREAYEEAVELSVPCSLLTSRVRVSLKGHPLQGIRTFARSAMTSWRNCSRTYSCSRRDTVPSSQTHIPYPIF